MNALAKMTAIATAVAGLPGSLPYLSGSWYRRSDKEKVADADAMDRAEAKRERKRLKRLQDNAARELGDKP